MTPARFPGTPWEGSHTQGGPCDPMISRAAQPPTLQARVLTKPRSWVQYFLSHVASSLRSGPPRQTHHLGQTVCD